jgi:ribonuclease I
MINEISLEERNAIYERTGGCFGTDPDAYGREIEAAYQRLNPPQLKPFQCCEQAVSINCVCAHSYRCPVHGEKHIGSHD